MVDVYVYGNRCARLNVCTLLRTILATNSPQKKKKNNNTSAATSKSARLHLLRPDAGDPRYLDLSLHQLEAGKARITPAETGLPVLARAGRRAWK